MRSISSIIVLLLAFVFLAACDNSSGKCEGACLSDFSFNKDCQNSLAGGLRRMSGPGADVRIAAEGMKILLTHKNAYFNCAISKGSGEISGTMDFNETTNTFKLTEKERYGYGASCTCAYEVNFSIDVPEYGLYNVEIWSDPVYTDQNQLLWTNKITVDGTGARFSDADEPPIENWDY